MPPDGQFEAAPYDNYGELLDKLIERIPDFNMRLKVKPKTNRIEFSANVNFVFDIAWFTLARTISEDPPPENKGRSDDRSEGIMICCRHCGDFLIRRNGRQEYSDKPSCQKFRNAKNQREFRNRRRIENAQKHKKITAVVSVCIPLSQFACEYASIFQMKNLPMGERRQKLRYLGNKDSITDIIKNIISTKVRINPTTILFDALCGTGSIANAFKTTCNVIINDSLNCATTYAYGRMVAASCTFNALGFNPFEFFNTNENIIEGFFYANYSPGGSDRMYLSPYNAGRVDYFRQTIEEWHVGDKINEKEYRYLLACLIESVSFVSNTAGVYGAFLKKWDERALKNIQFIDLSDSISPMHNIDVYTEKLEQIIENIQCNILYLDPPYTQNQYGTQYHLLETLVLNDRPKKISKVTGSRSTSDMRSDWSKIYKVHILLDKILAKTSAQHIFLSYNNDGDMSKDFIEAIMKRYGYESTFERIEIPYKKYENWKSQNKKEHYEYLFYIQKKPIDEIVFESPLNYIGSKAKVIPYIRQNLIVTDTFVDVFGGGFNVGINSASKNIIYNDINFIVKQLIESFQKYDTYDYIIYAKKFIEKHQLEKGNKESYLSARDFYNELPENKKDPRMLFTIILYSFQQQIRFNSNYGFNNTAGVRWFNDCILAKLISFSRVIKEKNITFLSDDFTCLSNHIAVNKDTFLYLDPPYKLTTGSYNDGKRGFKGWDDELEQELFTFIDEMTQQNVPCMLSYVLEHKSITNTALEEWITRNNYTYIPLGDIVGISGQPRKEILILNYDL